MGRSSLIYGRVEGKVFRRVSQLNGLEVVRWIPRGWLGGLLGTLLVRSLRSKFNSALGSNARAMLEPKGCLRLLSLLNTKNIPRIIAQLSSKPFHSNLPILFPSLPIITNCKMFQQPTEQITHPSYNQNNKKELKFIEQKKKSERRQTKRNP